MALASGGGPVKAPASSWGGGGLGERELLH